MKRAFTLIELMLAILLGAMIVMMIAGSLRAAINAWEAVERTSATNYNRRTVLDIMKRQSSSLFYAEDADELNNQSGKRDMKTNPQDRNPKRRVKEPKNKDKQAFSLPGGANYFKGESQQIEFVSTVSFLSDFPGQVSVKYYIVQEDPEDEDAEPGKIGESAPPPPPPGPMNPDGDFEDSDDWEAEELEGNLYIAMQETNLFLNQTEPTSSQVNLDEKLDEEGNVIEEELVDEISLDELLDEEPKGTTQVKLLGPLRKFSIRYRIPASRDKSSEDSEEDWEESWDINAHGGQYPVAIEFTLFYEVPGVTDHIDTEDLDGIRMVIPVYSSNNLNERGNSHANFFDE